MVKGDGEKGEKVMEKERREGRKERGSGGKRKKEGREIGEKEKEEREGEGRKVPLSAPSYPATSYIIMAKSMFLNSSRVKVQTGIVTKSLSH